MEDTGCKVYEAQHIYTYAIYIPTQSSRRLHSALPATQAPYMHRNAYLGHVVAMQFSVVSSLPSLFY